MNKKEFLEEYKNLKLNAEDARMNCEYLKSLAECAHQTISDMPTEKTNENYHENLLARYVDAKDKAERLESEANKAKQDVFNAIMSIDNMRLQTILLMAHIELMQWKEIEDKTGISIQHLQKLRRDGENLITIPSSYATKRATKCFRQSAA